MTKQKIYIVGVILLGLSYYFWKGIFSGPVFLTLVVIYALALRLVAERFGSTRE